MNKAIIDHIISYNPLHRMLYVSVMKELKEMTKELTKKCSFCKCDTTRDNIVNINCTQTYYECKNCFSKRITEYFLYRI